MTDANNEPRTERSPGAKLLFALIIAGVLAIPLFAVWLLVYDRQNQSETARASIAEGWGGPQNFAGPMLVIPYQAEAAETVEEAGRQVTRTQTVWRELFIAPSTVTLDTAVTPERRQRSIYEAVVYEARVQGRARYDLPADLARQGIAADRMAFDRAELRFGLSDARGVAADNRVAANGQALTLKPGNGVAATGGSGFHAPYDAGPLLAAPVTVDFSFGFRGNAHLTLSPRAGQTVWTIRSAWPHPSFQGGFLPTERRVDEKGFAATYRISNLALGTTLVSSEDARPSEAVGVPGSRGDTGIGAGDFDARVSLVQPVDIYSRVDRSVKYGFLFIGFTFIAFLMFDVIGGVRVSSVEYLLVGAALVLFFVLLLAFAEVIGFTAAYMVASAAIIALITAYSAAVLRSRRRAGFVGALLVGLYAVLYVLLSLEAYSLLIGSLLVFAALAGVMYATRQLDWGARRQATA